MKPTLVLKLKTGEFIQLKNAREIVRNFNLSKSQVTTWLKNRKIQPLGGILFTYVDNDLGSAKDRLTEAARLLKQ